MKIPRLYPPDAPLSWVRMCRTIGSAIRPRPRVRRYPLAALLTACGVSEYELTQHIGLTGTSLKRAREQGFSQVQADRYAVRAGFVPWMVWPAWIDDVIADELVPCADPRCDETFIPTRAGHRYHTPECSSRVRNRDEKRVRYHSDPGYRAAKQAANREYRAKADRAVKLKQAAYRVANAERIAAKHAAWRAANVERTRATSAAYYQAHREERLAKQREIDKRRRAKAAA